MAKSEYEERKNNNIQFIFSKRREIKTIELYTHINRAVLNGAFKRNEH